MFATNEPDGTGRAGRRAPDSLPDFLIIPRGSDRSLPVSAGGDGAVPTPVGPAPRDFRQMV